MTTPVPEGGPAGGPIVGRMLLGAHLRRLREALGITREDAGWHIRSSESKISRMELGRVSFKVRDVADLLTLYEVTDDQERSRLLKLADEANSPGWWHRFGDALPSWFQSYLGLEAATSQIRSYQVQFVPGLLQTSDYARAVVSRGRGHGRPSPEEIERRVAMRMARQQLLERDGAPLFWAVLDESVLRRPVGGAKVLRGQIESLIRATDQPNIRLQMIRLDADRHAVEGGAFSILRFPDPGMPDVVYVELLNSALYFDKRDEIEQYTAAMERLCVDAEPPAQTVDLLKTILDEL